MKRPLLCIAGMLFIGFLPMWGATWKYVRYRNIEILSQATEGSTERMSEFIHNYPQLIKRILPRLPIREKWPMRVVITNSNKEFNNLAMGEKYSRTVQAYYSDMPDYDLIVINMTSLNRNYYRDVVYHELTHLVLNSFNFPRWFEEGIAQFFEGMEVTSKTQKIGIIQGHQVREIRIKGLIDWETFFRTTNVHEREASLSNISQFYAQAYLLVHYIMIGADNDEKLRWLDFLDKLESPFFEESEFKSKLGYDYKALQKRIRKYYSSRRFHYLKVKTSNLTEPPELTYREADPDTMARILGGVLTGSQKYTQARSAILPLYDRPETAAALHETAYLIHRRENFRKEAIEHAEKAVEAGSTAPGACLYVLHHRLEEMERRGEGLSVPEINEFIKLISNVVSHDQSHREAWLYFLKMWLISGKAPPSEDWPTLEYALETNKSSKPAKYFFFGAMSRTERRHQYGELLRNWMDSTKVSENAELAQHILRDFYAN